MVCVQFWNDGVCLQKVLEAAASTSPLYRPLAGVETARKRKPEAGGGEPGYSRSMGRGEAKIPRSGSGES